jgi:uncharacterized membrane protein YcaP (DUF421 family)
MELVIRASVIYWFLWLVVRGTGKRSLAELSPIDLVVIVVIGDVVEQGVTQEDMSITGAVVAVAVFALWMLVGDALSRRWRPAGRILGGSPVLLVVDGEPQFDAIDRERLTIEDVHEAARQRGFGDLHQVAFGVLEPDGGFSFVPRSARTSEPPM